MFDYIKEELKANEPGINYNVDVPDDGPAERDFTTGDPANYWALLGSLIAVIPLAIAAIGVAMYLANSAK